MRKKRTRFQKYLPCCGLIPAWMTAVCIAISLSNYEAPVWIVDTIKQTDKTEAQQTTTLPQKQETTRPTMTTKAAPTIETISEHAGYPDGTYTGTGTGFNGPLTVQVVIQNGKISDISIVNSSDDASYLNHASALLKAIVSVQSTNVDVISGATFSSAGLIEAVRDALKKAQGDSSSDQALPQPVTLPQKDNIEVPIVSAVTEPALYQDGVYTGSGLGFAGMITVKVTVQAGKISGITMISNSDDSPYIDQASALLKTIPAAQSTNVDAVSGATYSSSGIIEAVRDALKNAAVHHPKCTTAASVTKAAAKKTTARSQTTETGKHPYPDGTYTGSAEGYRGETFVSVTLKNGCIEHIQILKTADDASFFQRAEALIPLILAQQNTNIDAVSGATFSSEGILGAVEAALESAKQQNETTTVVPATLPQQKTTTTVSSESEGTRTMTGTNNMESHTTTTETVTTTASRKYKDGAYAIEVICSPDDAEDFASYTLSLIVVIADDMITEIQDISGNGSNYDAENDFYINRAASGTSRQKGVVAQILEQQSTDGIDAVSSATCSSHAIIEAVEQILKEATEQ